jgi:hypothetical protein
MSEVRVLRISRGGLHKQIYVFAWDGDSLNYIGHYDCYRSTRKETWADQEKDLMSMSTFCKNNNLYEYDDASEDAYIQYRRDNNPVCQKTRQGKTKLSGVYAQIESLPVCPDDVAADAKAQFIRSIKVEYEVSR